MDQPDFTNLSSILSHLLPPAYPLPPSLLSHALRTRQVYLPPPPMSLHDGYITQRPSRPEDSISRRLVDVSERLKRETEMDAVQGEGGGMAWLAKAQDRLTFTRKDEETLLAQIDLSPYVGRDEVGSDSRLGIVLINEPGAKREEEWKLFNVEHIEDQTGGTPEWTTSIAQAEDRFLSSHQTSQYHSTETDGEPQDFWSNYSSSPPPPTQPLPSTHSHSHTHSHAHSHEPALEEDDSYWHQYATVEDGLKVSNPPTPARGMSRVGSVVGMSGMSGMTGMRGTGTGTSTATATGTGAGANGYWGTGGETPVGWSPQIRSRTVTEETPEEEPGYFPTSQPPLDDHNDHPVQANQTPSESSERLAFAWKGIGSSETQPSSSGSNQNVPENSNANANTIANEPSSSSTTPSNLTPARTALSARPGKNDTQRRALRETIRSIRALYTGDEDGWKEVLNEFL